MNLFRRYPPLVWLIVYVGSLLVVMGTRNPWLLGGGIVMITAAFVGAVWLAMGPTMPGHPRPRGAWLWIGGVFAFYAISAAVALFVGVEYALASLLAAFVPATAVALLVATLRMRTRPVAGHREDESADDFEDPSPAIGVDDETPLGDTPEHSDAHEGEPVAHPGERFARRPQPAAHRPANGGAYGAQVPADADRREGPAGS